MKLTIQGTELVVTIKSATELTTQQVVMAHQLATGDYQALFVNESDEDQNEKYKESPVAFEPYAEVENPPVKTDWVEKGDWVNVEVLCPFCGHTGKASTRWGNSFCKCPHCNEKLYNKLATEVAGEVNSYGCHYVADGPMKFKMSEDEYAEMFKGEAE